MIKYITFVAILLVLGGQVTGAMAEETLAWEDCIAEAKKNHPDLISAVENVNQQKAEKKITASGLFPQIDATAGASRTKVSGPVSGAVTTTSKKTDSYTYGASGTQLIFDGFKTVNQVNTAKENIEAAQQNYKFISSEVRLNLRTAFINLLKAQELINVAEDIVKIRMDDLMLITLRYESGLEHKGALLKAEASLDAANFELSQAKRDIELSQRQLTKEMGRQEFKPMKAEGEFSVQDSAFVKPDLETIAKNNPSLLELTNKKNAAAFAIRSAYANFMPELSGQAGANKNSSDWPPDQDKWNAGLSVNLPIFEGGLRTAQVSQAQAAYKQAEADERSKKDAVIVDLEQAWVSLQDAIEMVGVQRKSLEAGQARSNIAEAQFSTGFISFDNWIIIEDDLVRAKTAYLNARANALFAEANWVQAKGETLEYAE